MRRWSLLESYARLVCFGSLICFLAVLYQLCYGIMAREAPEYTISRWTYRNHQTNERYWEYAGRSSRPRPPEEALTAEREQSWKSEQIIERRDGTRIVWLSGMGATVLLVVFGLHWRVARLAKREERVVESDRIRFPLVLASVIVLGSEVVSVRG